MGDIYVRTHVNHQDADFAEASLPSEHASMQARSVVVHGLLVVVKLCPEVSCCIAKETSKASRATTAT